MSDSTDGHRDGPSRHRPQADTGDVWPTAVAARRAHPRRHIAEIITLMPPLAETFAEKRPLAHTLDSKFKNVYVDRLADAGLITSSILRLTEKKNVYTNVFFVIR